MKHHQQSLHEEVQDSSDLVQILTILLVHRKLSMTSTVILCSLSLDSFLFSLKHMMTLRQMQQLKSHLPSKENRFPIHSFHCCCCMSFPFHLHYLRPCTEIHLLAYANNVLSKKVHFTILYLSTECAFSKKSIALAMLHCRS